MPTESAPAGALGLVRPVLAVAVLFAAYALLPVPTGSAAVAAVVTGALSIGVFLWVVQRQARRIIRSPRPALAAVEALSVLASLFVLSFALTYVALSTSDPTSFSQPVDKVAGLYFTMTVLSTVGFGDIVAVSDFARMTVVVQMVANIVLLATVVRLIVGIARWTLSEGAKVAPVPEGGAAT